MRKSAYKIYTVLWIILLFASFAASFYIVNNIWLQLLMAANLASFLLYGIDKIQAQIKRRRVPEKTLYLAAFVGGPVGALLAMHLFRHKTRKLSFQLVLALLILIELAAVLLILDRTNLLSLEIF